MYFYNFHFLNYLLIIQVALSKSDYHVLLNSNSHSHYLLYKHVKQISCMFLLLVFDI